MRTDIENMVFLSAATHPTHACPVLGLQTPKKKSESESEGEREKTRVGGPWFACRFFLFIVSQTRVCVDPPWTAVVFLSVIVVDRRLKTFLRGVAKSSRDDSMMTCAKFTALGGTSVGVREL